MDITGTVELSLMLHYHMVQELIEKSHLILIFKNNNGLNSNKNCKRINLRINKRKSFLLSSQILSYMIQVLRDSILNKNLLLNRMKIKIEMCSIRVLTHRLNLSLKKN